MRRVYFIRPIGMQGPVKIGCSKSPDGRRKTLENWSPFALEIIAEIDGNELLERQFHARFRHLHERREWFRWSPEIDEVVAQIRNGSFDAGTLPPPAKVTGCDNGIPRRRTEAQRRQFSYSLRVSHMEWRSGYSCPIRPYGVVERGTAEDLAAVEAYLADPAVHGRPASGPWAESARQLWHAGTPRKRTIRRRCRPTPDQARAA